MIDQYLLHAKRFDYHKAVMDAWRRIDNAMNTGRKFYFSFSGGKDSTVLLDMVLHAIPMIPVLHVESGYSLPDAVEFVGKIKDRLGDQFHEIGVPMDYLQLCREFGLPHTRSSAAQKRVVKMIKKDNIGEWAQSNGFTGVFWGIRSDESRGRAMLNACHPNGVLDHRNILRVAPLAQWTSADVWAYIAENNIEYNHLYDRENCGMTRETIRNTGWLSTDGENRGRIEWLRRNYPTYYARVRDLL